MLGLSLVFIPRFLNFIGAHLPTESGWEMHRDPLDANIEALPARVSVLRDYQAAAHQERAAQTFAGTSAPAAMPPIRAGEADKFYGTLSRSSASITSPGSFICLGNALPAPRAVNGERR
jgi:hypothetical protein